MNNERFVLALCALAGVAIIAFLSGVVFAHHKGEYRGMDDRLQNDFTSDPENHISANWALTPTVGSAVTWFTDDPKTPNPTITPIAPLVRKSIAEWTTALPQLQYDEVGDDAGDDAKNNASIIFESSCGTSIGSFDPIERTPIGGGSVPLPAWHHDDVRNANYWTRARICVNVASFSNDVDIVSAISHELGHAYGLGEAYNDKRTDPANHGACSPGPLTIMDGTKSNGSHCDDAIGPEGHDIKLVKGLFARGGVSDFTATNNQDGTATFTWKDNAWGEIRHDVAFYYSEGYTRDPALRRMFLKWKAFETYANRLWA